ncbi:unnamed protein product [Miscanthus lutarioriparius]|uniref:Uncharacterized protein n=1 Tax=Miscanthus lutarioriparius TaxID=422564 RepID=A0A811RZF7_9POAL|nr:unnamed protein product [Miscanthus lutarioriparius]
MAITVYRMEDGGGADARGALLCLTGHMRARRLPTPGTPLSASFPAVAATMVGLRRGPRGPGDAGSALGGGRRCGGRRGWRREMQGAYDGTGRVRSSGGLALGPRLHPLRPRQGVLPPGPPRRE